jgi:hypothetical protein
MKEKNRLQVKKDRTEYVSKTLVLSTTDAIIIFCAISKQEEERAWKTGMI